MTLPRGESLRWRLREVRWRLIEFVPRICLLTLAAIAASADPIASPSSALAGTASASGVSLSALVPLTLPSVEYAYSAATASLFALAPLTSPAPTLVKAEPSASTFMTSMVPKVKSSTMVVIVRQPLSAVFLTPHGSMRFYETFPIATAFLTWPCWPLLLWPLLTLLLTTILRLILMTSNVTSGQLLQGLIDFGLPVLPGPGRQDPATTRAGRISLLAKGASATTTRRPGLTRRTSAPSRRTLVLAFTTSAFS